MYFSYIYVSALGRVFINNLMRDVLKYIYQACMYGVATSSRLLKTVGLLCRIQSLLEGSFAKETYDLKPTKRGHF